VLKFIKIRNFKSIDEEIELSFEPLENRLDDYYLTKDKNLKLAIIYGPNASGKTNIIKAIKFLKDFIFNPPSTKDKQIKVEPFKFKDIIDEVVEFELEFIIDKTIYNYKLSLTKDKIVKEELFFKRDSKRFSRAFIRGIDKVEWGRKIKISASQKEVLLLNTLPNNSILSAYLKVNLEIDEIDDVIKFFSSILPPIYPNIDLTGFVLNKLEKGEILKSDIIKILQNADFSIDDFNINEDDADEDFIKFLEKFADIEEIEDLKEKVKTYEILFTHYKKYILNYDEESRGTQRFYQLATILILLTKNSYILPIDEIESSLHPDLLKFFILIFLTNTTNSQIIMTTHLRELLLEKEILRNDAIWFCEKRENGSTDLFSLIDFKSEIRENSSIYNFYKNGKLGATPNIKNFLGLIDGKKE